MIFIITTYCVSLYLQYENILKAVEAKSPQDEIRRLREELMEGSRMFQAVRRDMTGSLGGVR